MSDADQALRSVTSLITEDRAKALLVDLARIPSPLTNLLEAEPQLRTFILSLIHI